MSRDARSIGIGLRGALITAALGSALSPTRALAEPPATAEAGSEVVVRAVRPRQESMETGVGVTQASQTAGTQGDPAKIVEDLPGVARASLGADPLVVWGSPASDTRVYVDGVEIPALFHGEALRSTVNGDLIAGVGLTPGAYGAEYGRALGGIVRIDTRELPHDGFHGSIDANFLDGSAFVRNSLGERVRVAVAGRYSWLDRGLSLVDTPSVAGFFPIPRYHDYQAKMELDLRERESLAILVLGSADELTHTSTDTDPAHLRRATTNSGFERVSFRYARTYGDGSRMDVIPWVGRDTKRYDGQFGAIPAVLGERDLRWGLRAEHRSTLASRTTLALGMDSTGTHATVDRHGSLTLPAREGDVTVFGETPGDDTAADTWHASMVDVAPYALVDWEAGPVTLTPALRADAYLIDASRNTPRVGQTPSIGVTNLELALQPRLSANVRLAPRVVLLATAGLYSQPPQPSDLSAVFGTPTLGPERGFHATLGEKVDLTPLLSTTLVGFYKRTTDLAVRDAVATPKLARALLGNGEGSRTYGVQVMIRQKPWHGFFGWVTYTVSRSEVRDASAVSYYLSDQDEPELFTVVVNQNVERFTVGIRFRYAHGLPRTPVVGALYDEKDDAFQPVFGAHNSIRLPAFWQLDARVDRHFPVGESGQLTLYLEALNVTAHTNGEEYSYNLDYSKRGVVTGLPFLGIVGAKLEL